MTFRVIGVGSVTVVPTVPTVGDGVLPSLVRLTISELPAVAGSPENTNESYGEALYSPVISDAERPRL